MDLDEAVSSPAPSALPTREASRRKRTAKNIGADFVTDYYPASSRSAVSLTNNNLSETAAIRRALRLSARNDRTKHHSEENIREATPESTSDSGLCTECLSAAGNFPSFAETERRFVRCSNSACPYIAHAGCTGISGSGEPEASFKCGDCKRCVVCQSGKIRRNNRLIQCLSCFKVYHFNCHQPLVNPEIVEICGSKMSFLPGWQCADCTGHNLDSEKYERRNDSDMAEMDSDVLEPETRDSQMDGERACSREQSEEISPPTATHRNTLAKPVEVPNQRSLKGAVRSYDVNGDRLGNEERELRQDLAMWSVEQCAAYFIDSQPDLADLISRHDLYGSSLMLISRAQFSRLFGLSIGKNLKLFGAICKWRKMTF